MEDAIVFMDKSHEPGQNELADKLGDAFHLWQEIEDFVIKKISGWKKRVELSGQKIWLELSD